MRSRNDRKSNCRTYLDATKNAKLLLFKKANNKPVKASGYRLLTLLPLMTVWHRRQFIDFPLPHEVVFFFKSPFLSKSCFSTMLLKKSLLICRVTFLK